jgi:UDP-glucose 4-epimerase
MRVLLVGGIGYIGSSVAAELYSRGHDLLLAGRKSQSKKNQWGETVVWDAAREWEGPVPKVDAVVHLASANGDQTLDSLDTYVNNLAVTRNILELCGRIDGAAVLYVSTLQVFGRWSGIISAESSVRPTSEYGFSHWVAEEHVKMFARTRSRQSLILRLSNVVGVGADPDTVRWGTVPADFCLQAVRNRVISIRSNGNAQRDFVTVTRTAERICELVESARFWDGRVVLVASGTSSTIREIANTVSEVAEGIIGVPVQIEPALGNGSQEIESQLQVVCGSHHRVESAESVGSEIRSAIVDLMNLAVRKVV